MKSTLSIEEETLLPSSLFEEDENQEQEIISATEYIPNKLLKKKAFCLEPEMLKSNFSNSKVSTFDLKEDISKETNNWPKEKDEQNFKINYFTHSNSSNDSLKLNKYLLDEEAEKKWSQMNSSIIPELKKLEPNQNDYFLNVYEDQRLNMEKYFPGAKLNERIDNRFNGILNNFTNDLRNINNINFINNKNNIINNKNEEIKTEKKFPNFYVNNEKYYSSYNKCKQENLLTNIQYKNKINFNNINIDFNKNVKNINYVNNIINLTNHNYVKFRPNIFPHFLPYFGKENINICNNSLKNRYLNDFNYVNKFNSFNNSKQKIEYDEPNDNNHMKKNDSPILKKEIKETIINDFNYFCQSLKPSLVDYICSKDAKKIIQQQLNFHKSLKIKLLIKKIFPFFEKIICDKYGNYFFQKMYIISPKKLRLKTLNYIKNYFVTVSKDEIGVYAIQKIIEEAQTHEEKKLIMEFIKEKEMEMALDKEGTHIIQKIIQIFLEDERQSLTDVFLIQNNLEKLLQNSDGINVIKRIISFTNEKSNKMKLLEGLSTNIFELLKSSNGSCIIYYIIEYWGIDIGINIVNILIYYFEAFATNKYSSNLIHKIIKLLINKCDIYKLYKKNYNKLSDIILLNEFKILKTFKMLLFEHNKIINIYENKYAKDLIFKIKSLFTLEENKLFNAFINSLKYCDNKNYKIYLEIFNSH